jgi:hypothetical protein
VTQSRIPVPPEIVEVTPETEFESFLAVVRNSVGSHMFRNFFVRREGELFDALHDGERSCAFYVSSILTIFKKIGSFHNTVRSTVQDLARSGWVQVEDLDSLAAGDVLVWGAELIGESWHSHVGFYLTEGTAVSISAETGTPVRHHDHPNHAWSAIAAAYRLPTWAPRPAPPVEGAR